MAKLARTPVEFFRVDIGDGVKLDGWLMKPPDFDPAKKYPLLFHVYGEPAGQTVTDRWGGQPVPVAPDAHPAGVRRGVRRQPRHAVPARPRLAEGGVPARSARSPRRTRPRPRRELLKRPYLDATRVGVWGWSGGGSMTLNLLFRHPDLYRTGMAVAPVPDMRLYDTIYQERYMGLPQDNAEDYKQGSPITHAAGLKGNLLLVHGTGDDNVPLPGDGEAGERADRAEQAVHADGVPEPQPLDQRGEEHDAAPVRAADALPERQPPRRPETVE